jgi:pimeloyl-ACP methyl ester carboxylesterase
MQAMTREPVSAAVAGGELVGWVEGSGPPVLLLHGGPGLSYTYLDDLAGDLGSGYRVASFQQRGLSPSTTAGPFTVEVAVRDVADVLDTLGWERAYVIGHSWGGHLLLHLAVSIPDRLLGGLAVDPLGGMGDGGMATFGKEMAARIPEEDRRRAIELDQRAERGEGEAGDFLQSLRLFWPAYFAVPAEAPEMPVISASVESYSGLFASLTAGLPRLSASLGDIAVPFGVVAGGASPMPVEAAKDTADAIPGAWLEVIEDAGHFPWHEKPGRVGRSLDRLVASAGSGEGAGGP